MTAHVSSATRAPRWITAWTPILRFLLAARVPLGPGPLARSVPGGVTFVRAADQTDLNHPVEVADARRVFELHAFR